MKETTVEQHLVRRVRAMGGKCIKLVSPGSAGEPDRLLALPGSRVALVEVKRPGEKPRELQEHRIAEWMGLGVLSDFVSTYAEVDAFLARVVAQS